MKGSVYLGSPLGIRLELHLTFFLLLGFFAWQGYQWAGPQGVLGAVAAIGLIFLSVVLHELGHCLAARKYGIHVSRILLLPIGGMAQMQRMPREPRVELVVTAAGPIVNFAIVAILWVLSGGYPDSGWHIQPFPIHPRDWPGFLLLANLIMGVFNLLPIYPMDGGRILRALIAMRWSYLNATRVAVYTAKVLVFIGILGALLLLQNYLLALLLAFVWIGGELEYRQILYTETFSGLTIRDVTESPPVGISPEEIQSMPVVQADWPLEVYASLFHRRTGQLFAVYSHADFIGVINTRFIHERARQARGKPHRG